MIIFNPFQAAPHRHKIGKTEFIVHSYFCGSESIYQKLANLMESELADKQKDVQTIVKLSDYTLDNEPA